MAHPAGRDAGTPQSGSSRHRRRRRHHSGSRAPESYAWLDRISGGLILFLVVFTPWAFGTTQAWAVNTATAVGCGIGLLLAAKWGLRQALGHAPTVWGGMHSASGEAGPRDSGAARLDPWIGILGALTLLFLGYVLVSALNARADYNEATRQFEYFGEPWRWLPYSYDRGATWQAFWQYAGLAAVFWGVRDWLRHRVGADEQNQETPPWLDAQSSLVIPARLRLLLWVLCANGALLALVSILQRADGTNRLLWLLESRSGKPSDFIFGPWAYRGNAAQYFNLLWPVCLAFWLWMQERARQSLSGRMGRFDGPQLILLPFAIFMAACPMISGSRGGALISMGLGVAAACVILLVSRREIGAVVRRLTVGAMALAALAAVVGGWSRVRERLSTPDPRFATQIEVATNDFTLLLRLVLPPPTPEDKWRSLVTLHGDSREMNRPQSLVLGSIPNGRLLAQLLGTNPTNFSRQITTNPLPIAAGRELQVAIVRQGGLRFFADDQPLGGVDHHAGRAPGWNSPVQSRYLAISGTNVTGVALLDFAMTPGEIAATANAALESLREGLPQRSASSPLTNLASAATQPIAGVQAETSFRHSQPDVAWLALRRSGKPGPLGVVQHLEGIDPRIRGPVRVRMTVWNPSGESVHLGISLDQGPRALAEVPPRSERSLSVSCRASHPETPRRLELLVVDEDGGVLDDLPLDAQLLVRDVQLQPGGSIFAQRLERRLRLVDLSDRMSGRGEVYETAKPMLDDFPWWGSGAGTFSSIYQLYLKPGQDWAAYLHNDWMEFQITLGKVGLGMLVTGLAVLFLRSWFGQGLPTLRVIPALWWLALAGCLAHARFDFPFQIYSVLFLFVVLASAMTVLTAVRRR